MTFIIYVIAGLCAGLAGLVLLAMNGQGYTGIGDPYLLTSIAAVVLGGTPILGGRGSYAGTIAGALLLSSMAALITMLNASAGWRSVILGCLILALLPRQAEAEFESFIDACPHRCLYRAHGLGGWQGRGHLRRSNEYRYRTARSPLHRQGPRNPTYIVCWPSMKRFYCVQETRAGDDPRIFAFAIDDDKISSIGSTGARGGLPCHISLKAASGQVFLSNYETGTLVCFELTGMEDCRFTHRRPSPGLRTQPHTSNRAPCSQCSA